MCGIQFLLSNNISNIDLFYKLFENIKPRGPEDTELFFDKFFDYYFYFGFQRLKINDVSDMGNQPFIYEDEKIKIFVMLNGEIYNHKHLEKIYNFNMESNSDCEIILHLTKYFIDNNLDFKDLFKMLDGVFAGVISYRFKNNNSSTVYCFRDIFGVRPLYYGHNENGIGFSSELKGLVGLFRNIKQFQPGCYMKYQLEKNNSDIILNKFIGNYYNYFYPIKTFDEDTALEEIRIRFENAVKKRLMSDRPVCCLLSGGLDSSLVASVLAKHSPERIHTFCVGMDGGEDLKYARMVAEHINSVHHEIILTQEDFLNALPTVVKTIETYDGTTCRASTGQYLVSKYIKENTDFKVVYVGEGSDELTGGYLYFHNAPNEHEFDYECKRLLKDIHYFDGKRSDRCISHFGLESRVPFLDKEFTEFYLSIDPKIRFHKLNGDIEKYLLRKSFDEEVSGYSYLPKEVLWRVKEAFSDGVSSKKKSWYQIIQEYCHEQIGDEFEEMKKKYGWYLMPYNEELYYYRKIFNEHYGEDNALVLPYFWLPKWSGNITEASARVLNVYKK